MKINYNKLLENYKVQFEGLNNPVFYSKLSPTHLLYEDFFDKNKNNDILNLYKFAHGLKATKENKYCNMYNEYKDEYKDEYYKILRTFFYYILQSNPKLKFGVISIPSSKKNITNCITIMIKNILCQNNYSRLFDYTNVLIRTETKVPFHENGNRNRKENINTLKVNLPTKWFRQVDGLIIVDDIITTGISFDSVVELFKTIFLNNSNFSCDDIICFALARSMNRSSILSYKRKNKIDLSIKNYKISGVIFDFDQTLVDSSKRNHCFESNIKKWKNLNMNKVFKNNFFEHNKEIYAAYDGVKFFQEKHVPFAIVSDSGKSRLNILLQTKEVQSAIYPDAWKMHYDPDNTSKKYYEKYFIKDYNPDDSEKKHGNFLVWRYNDRAPKNLFPYERKEEKYNGEKETIIFTKPNCHSICKAIKWMKINFNLICPRIIGVGNTLEDIIAYHNAGIEAVLALWGVPEILKDYAKSNWEADYVFTTFREFTDWVEKENGDK